MTFQIVIDSRARREIDAFAAYANSFSDDYAAAQKERLDRLLFVDIARSPLRCG